MASSYFVLSVLGGIFAAFVFLGVGYTKFAWSSSKQGPSRSLSWANVQLITWTGVILGSYVVIAFLTGGFPMSIPDNLLTLMGVSVGAQVGSKLTRTLQTNTTNTTGSNNATKESVPPAPSPVGIQGLMAKESDPTELNVAKLQHLAWTIVGVIVYVIAVWAVIVPYVSIPGACGATCQAGLITAKTVSANLTLPDVGNGLPVLLGISASGYIANKIGDKPAQ